MIAFSNCKINIGLQVKSKRPDGFHEIETVFYPVPLCDVLEIIPSDNFHFEQTGLSLDVTPENNIIVNSYRLLKSKHKLSPVSIHLHKVIPSGAGLGGGSSNAANTLILLNNIFNLKLPDDELVSLASELGSDCPFFIKNKPAIAKGRGEVLEDVSINLKGKNIVIIKPKIHISTAEAYSTINPRLPDNSLRDLINQPVEQWIDNVVNDFEKVLFPKYPKIREIKNKLYEMGAVYASMSGSGSSVYGIFNAEIDLKDVLFGRENFSTLFRC